MTEDTKFTVLVVDDVADNIMVLDEILRGDYTIRMAKNGEKALSIVRSNMPPDIILLDIMMPGMDGYEVCRQIKSDDATAFIPVVMVTALTERGDRVKALEVGADDFLNKPVDPPEVKARVRSLLRLKKLRDDLQQSYSDLKKLEELRENLTSMIVHDMRTPLTSVIGAQDMLAEFIDTEGDPFAGEMYTIASGNSYKLLGMINDLLDITKMESGEMKIHPTAVNVVEVAEEVATTVRALSALENQTFTLEMPPDLPLVQADREMLRRVLVNLAGNAIKFTPQGGSIRLTAYPPEDNFLKLAVIDTGPRHPARLRRAHL